MQRNSPTLGIPLLINAKKPDEEKGMYYYAAGYNEPKLILWTSVNPIACLKLDFRLSGKTEFSEVRKL